MAVIASRLFSFLEQTQNWSVERRELYLEPFSRLRKATQAIVIRLNEDDDEETRELAGNLRACLSELLTVPVPFNDSLSDFLAALGDVEAIERRWGQEVRTAYDHACTATQMLRQKENPARMEIRESVDRLRGLGSRWKIYCHRRARAHFESVFVTEPVPADAFLHSVKEYRDAEPFDALLKMGSLRSKGWGSAPDAILSAPRFTNLIQIVWSGCIDEEEFGYDPANLITKTSLGTANSGDSNATSALRWQRTVFKVGTAMDFGAATQDTDELKLFHDTLDRPTGMRRATLVEIDAESGILYPPNSLVPTLDASPNTNIPFDYRTPGETLQEGMFLICPALEEVDLGTLRAGEGSYSRIWKDRLRVEMQRAPDDLVERLRRAGIDLQDLQARLRRWSRPASRVIHAPQRRRHFESLIRVLGIDHEPGASARVRREPWWAYAWREIGHSRGEAIQTGIQEHEIVDEQLFLVLNEQLPRIRAQTATTPTFEFEIPAGKGLVGSVYFWQVRSIEEGFLVPENRLKTMCDLEKVEQWRV